MSIFKRFKRKLLSIYHHARNIWPVWYYVLNRSRRQHWKRYSKGHALNPKQEQIAETLHRDGIAITHISELLEEDVFQKLSAYAADMQRRWKSDAGFRESILAQKDSAKKGNKKEFLIPLYGGGWTRPELELSNPCITFALHKTILEIIGAYFELSPRFVNFSLHETVIVEPKDDMRLSQRWHRDPEDKKMCKVFIYLSNVDEVGAGPFTYIRGSQLGGKWRHLFPQRPPVGVYPEEGAVERLIPKEDIKVCFGNPGTIIFADTSGLHRGGHSTTKSRFMFSAGFASDASYEPIKYTLTKHTDAVKFPRLADIALP